MFTVSISKWNLEARSVGCCGGRKTGEAEEKPSRNSTHS